MLDWFPLGTMIDIDRNLEELLPTWVCDLHTYNIKDTPVFLKRVSMHCREMDLIMLGS